MSTARSMIEISGDDRIAFLQGLLTQDVSKLAEARIQFAALLSPQGKILHDMFLIDRGDAILLDTPAVYAQMLRKRLNMYKLRANVTISDDPMIRWPDDPLVLTDPRHPSLPPRRYASTTAGVRVTTDHRAIGSSDHFGIPDSTADFTPDSLTAMDAGYDLLNAISFSKGCYVGQEIVARMHYKNIARKGFFLVEAQAPLVAGAALIIGGKETAVITRAEGATGLAFLKFEEALGDREKTVDNQPVRLRAPEWMAPKLRAYAASEKMQ